jgi:hypothetical protein
MNTGRIGSVDAWQQFQQAAAMARRRNDSLNAAAAPQPARTTRPASAAMNAAHASRGRAVAEHQTPRPAPLASRLYAPAPRVRQAPDQPVRGGRFDAYA